FLHDSPSLIRSEDAAPRTDCPREVQLEARSRVFEKKGIPVLAVVRVDIGLDDLHVLLRHRLLRETDGFEGCAFVHDALHPHDLSAPEGKELEIAVVTLDPA